MSISKSFPFFFLGMLLICAGSPTIARADHFSWASDKTCNLYADSGRWKSTVDDSYCGNDFFRWATDRTCNLYAGSGRWKSTVDDTYCGKDYFGWATDKTCNLYAGSGRWKSTVDDQYCGNDFFSWATDRTCNLYAGSGRWKSTVDDSYCSRRSAISPEQLMAALTSRPQKDERRVSSTRDKDLDVIALFDDSPVAKPGSSRSGL